MIPDVVIGVTLGAVNRGSINGMKWFRELTGKGTAARREPGGI